MKASEITDAMRLCMHREPALRKPTTHDHNTDSQIPDPKHGQLAETLASDREGKAQGAVLPLVLFTLCRVSLLDVDAKWASVKDLLDGLRYAGLIRGDKEGEISLEVRQRKVKKKDEEVTEITLATTYDEALALYREVAR